MADEEDALGVVYVVPVEGECFAFAQAGVDHEFGEVGVEGVDGAGEAQEADGLGFGPQVSGCGGGAGQERGFGDVAGQPVGRTVLQEEPTLLGGSTDMGNVSHLVSSIHPMIGYDCGDTIMHNPEFTRFGTSAQTDRALLDGGLAMAWTALDLALDPGHRTSLLTRLSARRTAGSASVA
ncbi:hypothetical protein [Kitasatospora sp. NPDC048407]|uniref:hypothetical protein n=1 Tax=Kitasatospora sp. NPDC048407 TaxID=3364051 RepID=UPI003712C201